MAAATGTTAEATTEVATGGATGQERSDNRSGNGERQWGAYIILDHIFFFPNFTPFSNYL